MTIVSSIEYSIYIYTFGMKSAAFIKKKIMASE